MRHSKAQVGDIRVITQVRGADTIWILTLDKTQQLTDSNMLII